jgi:hypothetical protein
MKKLSLWIVLFMALAASVNGYAHTHRESLSPEGRIFQHGRGGEEAGGEATGLIAAWLFGIANFPVVLSIVLKTGRKLLPSESSLGKITEQTNRRQKRLLMKLHYWLNPIAAGVAILHLSIAECNSTLMPELGLGVMIFIIILGLMMTFRLSPSSMRKAIFRLHTSPVSLMAAILILIIGHAMIH